MTKYERLVKEIIPDAKLKRCDYGQRYCVVSNGKVVSIWRCMSEYSMWTSYYNQLLKEQKRSNRAK